MEVLMDKLQVHIYTLTSLSCLLNLVQIRNADFFSANVSENQN